MILLHILLVTLLQFSAGLPKRETLQGPPSKLLPDVIKSPGDKREYRAVELANELKVILVSDSSLERSAASITVNVGFLHDPKELPGFAHYLEHFLFVGENGEDLMDQYLAQNGGTVSNAYTNIASTTYFFECPHQSFEGAVKIFSNMFINPLLAEGAREGVSNAVESEFQGGFTSDYRRIGRVNYATSNANYSYSRIHIGSKEALWTRPQEKGIDVRMELVKHFKTHYSADIMSLAVVSNKLNLDDLQLLAEKYFSPIQNIHLTNSTGLWPTPWGQQELETRVNGVPLKDWNTLLVKFPIPDIIEHHTSGATHYLSSAIRNGEVGGLDSFLRRKKWISSIWADFDEPGKGFSFISLEISLTLEGVGHVDEIVLHIFQYLELLRRTGPQKWYWDELASLKETEWTYKESSGSAESLAVSLTDQMALYPVEEVWTAQYYPLNRTEYQPELITNLLDFMVPSNVRILAVAKDYENKTTEKEHYYGMEYSYGKIEKEVIQRWANCGVHEELKFPSPNKFIPTNFDLKAQEKKESKKFPVIIFDDAVSRLWFLQDDEFHSPKAFVRVRIMNPYTSKSARNRSLQNLLVNLIKNLMIESTYAATHTGLSYSLYSTYEGIVLQVDGYDHKIDILFQQTLQYLLNFGFMEDLPSTESSYIRDQFEDTKEAYILEKNNWKNDQPATKAKSHLIHLLSSQHYTNQQLLDGAKDLSLDDVLTYARLIFSSKVRLEWYIHGNLLKNDALDIHKKGFDQFIKLKAEPMRTSEVPFARETRLLNGTCLQLTFEEETSALSAVYLYFQTGQEEGVRMRAEDILLMFMELLLSERCYDTLRSKEHLGYSVGCRRCTSCGNGVLGFGMSVQGTKHPDYIQSRMLNFLHTMTPTVNNLTEEEFEKHKDAARIKLKSQKPKTLNAEAVHISTELDEGTYDFDSVNENLKKVDELSLDMVKEFFNTWLNPESPQRRMASVHGISTQVEEAEVEEGLKEFSKQCKSQGLLKNTGTSKDTKDYLPSFQVYNDIPPWKAEPI